MNRELKSAELLPNWSDDDINEMDKSHAGFLDEIGVRTLKEAGLFLITAPMYMGGGCSLDATAVLYDESSLKRVAFLNGEVGRHEYAYYLSGFDASDRNASGSRLVASGWGISNCTSSWNGKAIRIDRISDQSLENIFVRGLAAQDRGPTEENVGAKIDGDAATFYYNGAVGDSALLSTPAVAKYRVVGRHAVRQSPLALTRAGFIHEWLTLDDTDAGRWSEPEALAARKDVAADFHKHIFDWVSIGKCGGSPEIWEIALRIDELKKQYVFRIGGTRASELRMISIGDKLTTSCVQADITNGLEGAADVLP